MSFGELSHDQLAALAAEVLGEGHTLRFRVRGASMRPTIEDGDLVEVVPVRASALRRGQVVLVRAADGRVLVHRVVRVRGRTLRHIVTRGDALWRRDDAIASEAVLGRAIAVCRDGRRHSFDRGWSKWHWMRGMVVRVSSARKVLHAL